MTLEELGVSVNRMEIPIITLIYQVFIRYHIETLIVCANANSVEENEKFEKVKIIESYDNKIIKTLLI